MYIYTKLVKNWSKLTKTPKGGTQINSGRKQTPYRGYSDFEFNLKYKKQIQKTQEKTMKIKQVKYIQWGFN